MKLVRTRLAKGGVLLMSTPDASVYASHGDNPFHVREMTCTDFGRLLSESFDHHRILRQHVATGSAIVDLTDGPRNNGNSSRFAAYTLQQHDDGWRLESGIPHTYLLGVASDAPVDALVANSVLLDPDLTLAHDVDMQAQRDKLQGLYDDNRREVAELKAALEQSERPRPRSAARPRSGQRPPVVPAPGRRAAHRSTVRRGRPGHRRRHGNRPARRRVARRATQGRGGFGQPDLAAAVGHRQRTTRARCGTRGAPAAAVLEVHVAGRAAWTGEVPRRRRTSRAAGHPAARRLRSGAGASGGRPARADDRDAAAAATGLRRARR